MSAPQQPIDAKLEPLGAGADNLDGLNFRAAIVDKLHTHEPAHRDLLETATSVCRQPLPRRRALEDLPLRSRALP